MVNGTRTDYVLDGDTVVREMRDTNNDGVLDPIATYFNGMYKLDNTTGAIRWYIYDGLGSVLAEVDPSGVVTAGRKYDVYGLVRTGQAGISEHKFVGKLGHMSEDETGLIYMRARYMDPLIGRFISQDPAGDGGNWYIYCNNNPISSTDMNGKEPTPIDLWSGIFMYYAGVATMIAGGALFGWQDQFFGGIILIGGLTAMTAGAGLMSLGSAYDIIMADGGLIVAMATINSFAKLGKYEGFGAGMIAAAVYGATLTAFWLAAINT